MLLRKTITVLLFSGISFFGLNQKDSNTIWVPVHKIHASLSFENRNVDFGYSSHQNFATESVYFSQLQESDLTSSSEQNATNLSFELGYEKVFRLREEKKWFPWLGAIGSLRRWTFYSEMSAAQSSFEVIDTLTNSQGNSFVHGKGSELTYDVSYRNDLVALSASIRPYIYSTKSRKFAIYAGVGFAYDFGVKSKMEVVRGASHYISLNESIFSDKNTIDTEVVKSQVFDVSSLSFSLGCTFLQYYEFRYSYSIPLLNNEPLISSLGGHQLQITLTPALKRPEHLRFRM